MDKAPAIEYFEFDDHASGSGWLTQDEMDDTAILVKAIGWVIKETKKVVVVGSMLDTHNSNNSTAVRQYIVKSCIRKRKKVRV